jgi:hypothetical protein
VCLAAVLGIGDGIGSRRLIGRYTIRELQSDITKQLAEVEDEELRAKLKAETQLGIFVVHNK